MGSGGHLSRLNMSMGQIPPLWIDIDKNVLRVRTCKRISLTQLIIGWMFFAHGRNTVLKRTRAKIPIPGAINSVSRGAGGRMVTDFSENGPSLAHLPLVSSKFVGIAGIWLLRGKKGPFPPRKRPFCMGRNSFSRPHLVTVFRERRNPFTGYGQLYHF